MRAARVAAISLVLASIVASGPAAADGDAECRLKGRVADVNRGGTIAGAHVRVTDKTGVRGTTTSDRDGGYSIEVPPGEYDVVFSYRDASVTNHVFVTRACTIARDADGDVPGEVIVVQDQKPPAVPAKPIGFSPRRAPPYSDEALDKDAWTRAWLLLDVSSEGDVRQFKFLKRPGYDLEKIAASEAFRLKFAPARDEHGDPIRVWIVWGIEWPANGWLIAHNLPRTMLPASVGFPPHAATLGVPCRGSGPFDQGALHPGYRDCSEPDLSAAAKETWIPRPLLPSH